MLQGDASISTVDDFNFTTTEKENDIYKSTPQITKLPISSKKSTGRKAMVGGGSGRKGSKLLVASGSKKQPLTVLNKK